MQDLVFVHRDNQTSLPIKQNLISDHLNQNKLRRWETVLLMPNTYLQFCLKFNHPPTICILPHLDYLDILIRAIGRYEVRGYNTMALNHTIWLLVRDIDQIKINYHKNIFFRDALSHRVNLTVFKWNFDSPAWVLFILPYYEWMNVRNIHYWVTNCISQSPSVWFLIHCPLNMNK